MRSRTSIGCSVGSFLFLVTSAAAQVDLLTVTGVAGDDDLGQSVAGVGDVNGDGIPDFAVGVPGADSPGADAGAVRIYSGWDGALLAQFLGVSNGGRLGYAVANAGDFDADGFPDVVAGGFLVTNAGVQAGGIRVFSWKENATLFTAHGDSANDWFGFAVAGAGDIDGDGFGEIVVGAPSDDNAGVDTGSIRVFAGPLGATMYTRNGTASGGGFGRQIAGIGDASGDGLAEIAVGLPHQNTPLSMAGQIRVFSGVSGSTYATWAGTQSFEGLGRSVGAAGDFDGDTRADLLVGTNLNIMRIVSGVNGATLRNFAGGVSGDWFGYSGAVIGDFDGDGTPDVVAGASSADLNGTDSGGAFVFSGASEAILQTLRGASDFDDFGIGVSGIGDVNLDGRADVVIGANDAGAPGVAFGTASVFVGLPSSCANLPSSVDFNVDGVPDACQTCQSNIAAGGPGNMKQHVCGDPLTIAGSDAILGISQGTPNGLCVLLASTFHSPNPAFGGTIWPIPVQVMLTFTLDAEGSFRLPLQGGPNGPIHVYLQSIAPWVGGPKPYEISPATHLVLGY